MKRILLICLSALLFTLACSTVGISAPAPIPTMDVARIPTMIIETAQALATSNTATSVSPISTDTPIVVTATNTETATNAVTSTASATTTSSASATAITFTVSPTNTFISVTNTTATKTATSVPVFTATYAQSTATRPSSPVTVTSPPTSAVVPPATIPYTATLIPPTSIPPTAAVPCPAFNTSYESRVIDLINAERTKVGLSALSTQGQLGSAAQLHSADMACNNYFSHTGLDGSSSGDRAQSQGYSSSYVGENIAAGYSSPESVVQGWMKSPGHKANILGADYTEIGIGYAFGNDSDYGSYWTAVFASP